MEAHGVRDFPPDSLRGRFVRRALQAAVVDVILPAFAEQMLASLAAGAAPSRDLAARSTVYLQARTHYGVLDSAVLDPMRAVWDAGARRATTSPRSTSSTRASSGSPTATSTGSTLPPACTGRSSASPSRPPPIGRRSGDREPKPAMTRDARRGRRGRRRARDPAAGSPGSLADALEQAIATARDGQLEQLDDDVDLGQVLRDAATGGQGRSKLGRGRGTGLPTGRMPDRGVDRPPYPDEVQQARRYANRLRRAMTVGTRQIDKRTPGGRFDGRAYARGRAEHAAGRPVSTHPWRIIRQVTAPIQEPHVGLIIDTSGSMAAYEYALGPIAWIITDGLRQIGGRCATALFGNSAELLSDGSRPLALVPGIRTGGGTAFAGDAIELVSDQLEMTNPRRPRFVYVLSDGGWSDTRAGVERIRWLAELGVPTDPPLDRDRAAVGRVRPDHRDHRPGAGARPHRRRHRRRARRPPRPRAHPLNTTPRRSTQMPKPNPALLPRPALFDVTIADSPIDRRIERIPLGGDRARAPTRDATSPRRGSSGSPRCCAAPAS